MVVRTPVHGTTVGYNDIVSNLSSNCIFDDDFPRIYHFDVAPTVRIIYIEFHKNLSVDENIVIFSAQISFHKTFS